ncbi:MAG: enoyl-CoA hydratase/isomerase family protein [Cyanobacteria bacterium SZAS LIN-3]|nr:enoyl-CoA hydratase/isomerase family protein [Cyanobacteria bacterium SZAS LIN-3]
MSLLVTAEGEIATVSFNRPEARNAISRAMWRELPVLMSRLAADGARVIVITGESQCFAAGADIGELIAVADSAMADDLSSAIADGIEAIAQVKAATIAMIDGPCLGGGCLVAAACDLRYASQMATFSVPIAKLGIVLDQTNILRLAGLIGPAWTKELIYSAATIDSITAQSIGLVNDYFEDKDQLSEFVYRKANAIAANSINSILGVKATINSLYGPNRDLPEALRGPTAGEVSASYHSADLKARLAKIFQAAGEQARAAAENTKSQT